MQHPETAHDPTAKATADRIVALVVSFNRSELLQKSLDALAEQTRAPDSVLVMDNASTDDSVSVARNHSLAPVVVELKANTGGAGGFAAGIAYATEVLGADYVWLMDDDTIPRTTTLEEAVRVFADYPHEVALVGSKVVWTDDREHPMNTPRVKPGATSQLVAEAAMVAAVPIRSSSFVSMLVPTWRIRQVGLPVADYFIWNDDFEYSLRLIRGRLGLASRKSEVLHLTKTFGATDADPGERFYYEVRNKVWLLRKSTGLSFPERILYTGSSVVRWIKTIVKSQNKSLLLNVGRRGLVDGFAKAPRPNTVVLRDIGDSQTIAAVAAFESRNQPRR